MKGRIGTMTAKEYLKQLRNLDKWINAKLEQKERYMDMATRSTSRISAVQYGGTSKRSKVEDGMCRLIDLEKDIDREVDKLVDLRKEAMEMIDNIEDVRYRQVLEYRYCNGWSWEKIAKYMAYDEKYLHRLHGGALLKANSIMRKKSSAI